VPALHAAQVTVAVPWVPLTWRPAGHVMVLVHPVALVEPLFQVRVAALSAVFVHDAQFNEFVPSVTPCAVLWNPLLHVFV